MQPNLTTRQLWSISFGFFGVQIAYALQSANISRIFATLGADPHNLSYYWLLPPLAGIIVQPLVGAASDKTWCRLGRRIPYLLVGAILSVIVMALLPNAGNIGIAAAHTMTFALFTLMLMDTSINMAMQPFKMLVGDMVNQRQKAKAYSIQSLLSNAGSLVGFLFPFFLAAIGIANTAPLGEVPNTVVYSFYAGAIILILCVVYTVTHVREMPPTEYAIYHNIEHPKAHHRTNLFHLLVHAPRVFWSVGLVQFFCWFAFMMMWTYTTGSIAADVFEAPIILSFEGKLLIDTASLQYQEAGDWVGVLFAVQAIGSMLWSVFLPYFRHRKQSYRISLLLGAAGFISTWFIHHPYGLFISFVLIGCAWAAMLSLPFTILTNSLRGPHMGSYLGLFNATICLPQIVAAALGGSLLTLLSRADSLPAEGNMLLLAGVMLLLGAACVSFVRIEN